MRYHSRKFVLAALTLFVNAGLLVTGNLTDSSYAAVTSAVLLAYMAANVAQKAAAPKVAD